VLSQPYDPCDDLNESHGKRQTPVSTAILKHLCQKMPANAGVSISICNQTTDNLTSILFRVALEYGHT
jgi:hypothetical protein